MSGPPHIQSFEGRSPTGAALVVSGGDGTLFHLLQALSPPYPLVALVPHGRGNAVARDLQGRTGLTQIDLMEVEVRPHRGEPFTCTCASSVSFGYPTLVTRRSPYFRRLRRLSYAAASLITLPHRQEFEIQIDGKPAQTKLLTGVLVNNTRHVGGFVAFPLARCDDGRVDVMQLRAGYISQLIHHLSAITRTRLWSPAAITPAAAVVIRPAEPQELMLDGELYPNVASVRVSISPASLPCLVLRARR